MGSSFERPEGPLLETPPLGADFSHAGVEQCFNPRKEGDMPWLSCGVAYESFNPRPRKEGDSMATKPLLCLRYGPCFCEPHHPTACRKAPAAAVPKTTFIIIASYSYCETSSDFMVAEGSQHSQSDDKGSFRIVAGLCSHMFHPQLPVFSEKVKTQTVCFRLDLIN